jgi:hypothetical protein
MIDFAFEVLRVNESDKVMDVKYTAEGHDPLVISIMIPDAGVNVQDYISKHSPQFQWAQATKVLAPISVGFSGAISAPPEINRQDLSSQGPVQPIQQNQLIGAYSIDDVRLEAAIQRVLAANAASTV